MTSTDGPLPRSIAIAGAWGYIGRKFLEVALARGLETYVYDPGPPPPDVDLGRLTLVADEAEFYRLDAELFHLAVQPEHRREDLLLGRPRPPLILNEKPMALPGRPERCREIVAAVDAARAVMFYDFPELFDPLTARILEHLGRFRDLRLTGFFVQRSKDREDPANPRNRKRMVPIQYQETVHCLAFVLGILAATRGSLAAALADGVALDGRSEPYRPPNPEAYPEEVDGRCAYRARLGAVEIEGLTDFKRGAPWAKRRVVRGAGDGRPFEVDVSYLEGDKWLKFDGVDQPCDPADDSYARVLNAATRWHREVDPGRLMAGPYPNPQLAEAAYRLSAALRESCRRGAEVSLGPDLS